MKIYLLTSDHCPGGFDLDEELSSLPKVSVTGLVNRADLVIAMLDSLPRGGIMHILTMIHRDITVWCFHREVAVQENIKKQLSRQQETGKTTLLVSRYEDASEITTLVNAAIKSGSLKSRTS